MKKLLIHSFVLLAAGLVACSKTDTTVETAPSVNVEVVSRNLTSVTVKLNPTENTSRYKFALGNEYDKDNFLSDDIIGMVTEITNNSMEYTFTNLEKDTYYVVYAVAYDSNNNYGSVTARGVQTMASDFVVSQRYVSDNSAGFNVECSNDYYTWSYGLGTADDRDAFLDNLMPGIVTMEEDFRRQINLFDLTPDTDYVFYVIGYDRGGNESDLFQFPFKTYSLDDSFPNFEIKVGEKTNNFYALSYYVKPNSLASDVYLFVTEPNGYVDIDVLYSIYRSELDDTFASWKESGQGGSYTVLSCVERGGVIEGDMPNPVMECGSRQRAYLVTYDLNGKLAHVKRVDTTVAPYNADLKRPAAKDITLDIYWEKMDYSTAYVNITVDSSSDIVGYFLDLVDNDYFTRASDSKNGGLDSDLSKLYDEFIADLSSRGFFYMTNGYAWYGDTSMFADPEKEYFWAAVPVNGNGTQGMSTDIAISEVFKMSDLDNHQ